MKRLLLLLRGCPIGLLGPYGNETVATPNCDRLAASGAVFDAHFVRRPGDIPFRTSLIETGHSAFAAVAEQALQSSDSVAIASDLLTPPWIYDDEVFTAYTEDVFEENEVSPWRDPPPGPFPTDDSTLWHRLHLSAAAAMTTFDAELGRMLDRLDDQTLFILTATHGLPLGEHGIIGVAGSRPHEELVHVPMIVRFPQRQFEGHRVAGFTQPEDLGDARFETLQGLIEQTGRDHVISETVDDWTVRTADSCLIIPKDANSDRPPRLYDRPDDRWEMSDLAPRQPDRVEELQSRYRSL
jgi:arylsulfatase A-like enzyme